MTINYSVLPAHMRAPMRAYIEEGRPVDSFLAAILALDFAGAARHADDINQGYLFDYAAFLRNEAPAGCWGSREMVTAWIATKHNEQQAFSGKSHI